MTWFSRRSGRAGHCAPPRWSVGPRGLHVRRPRTTPATRRGSTDGSAGGGPATSPITFLPKNLGNPYFDTSSKGGKAAVEELGGTFKEVGPTEATADGAGQLHQHADPAGRRARSCCPPTTRRRCAASLDAAREADIKVVTFDSDVDAECRDLFINQATAEGIAKVQIDMIAEQIGDAGRDRDPVGHRQRDEPERVDRDDEGGPGGQPPEHRAGRHGLRRRRRPDVVRQDRRAAAVATRTSRASSRRRRSASPPRPATCRPRRTRARSR